MRNSTEKLVCEAVPDNKGVPEMGFSAGLLIKSGF